MMSIGSKNSFEKVMKSQCVGDVWGKVYLYLSDALISDHPHNVRSCPLGTDEVSGALPQTFHSCRMAQNSFPDELQVLYHW